MQRDLLRRIQGAVRVIVHGTSLENELRTPFRIDARMVSAIPDVIALLHMLRKTRQIRRTAYSFSTAPRSHQSTQNCSRQAYQGKTQCLSPSARCHPPMGVDIVSNRRKDNANKIRDITTLVSLLRNLVRHGARHTPSTAPHPHQSTQALSRQTYRASLSTHKVCLGKPTVAGSPTGHCPKDVPPLVCTPPLPHRQAFAP